MNFWIMIFEKLLIYETVATRGWVTPCWKQTEPLGAEDGPRVPLLVAQRAKEETAPASRAHSFLGSGTPAVALGHLSLGSQPASEPRALEGGPVARWAPVFLVGPGVTVEPSPHFNCEGSDF